MSDINVEKLISRSEYVERDAIHMAIMPAYASEDLERGDWIIIGYDCEARKSNKDLANAIVSPFITESVEKGDKFWAFMKPGTVSNLKHKWSHPAVGDDDYNDDYECRGCY